MIAVMDLKSLGGPEALTLVLDKLLALMDPGKVNKGYGTKAFCFTFPPKCCHLSAAYYQNHCAYILIISCYNTPLAFSVFWLAETRSRGMN